MSIYVRIDRLFEALSVFFWKTFIWIHEVKNIWSKRALVKSFKPTAEQAEDAHRYWKELTAGTDRSGGTAFMLATPENGTRNIFPRCCSRSFLSPTLLAAATATRLPIRTILFSSPKAEGFASQRSTQTVPVDLSIGEGFFWI